jgi:prolyl oligopeptidase
MVRQCFSALLCVGIVSVSLFTPGVPAQTMSAAMSLQYPTTATVDANSSAFGVTVPDPYRWLENDVRTDPKVREWVDAQVALTHTALDQLPGRAAIAQRLNEIWNTEKYSVPVRRNGKYFYRRNTGLQNQSPLFVKNQLNGAAKLLIDPNPWAKDGATALAEWNPSPQGTHLAYAVQDGGTDWRTVHFMHVASGKILQDELRWVKFSGLSWSHDGTGIYYSRFPETAEAQKFQSLNKNQAVYFHKLGQAQSQDTLVYATPDHPSYGHHAEVTHDGHYLVITTSEGTDDRYEITIQDLKDKQAKPFTLFKGLTHSWSLIESIGTKLIFVTNLDAPKYRIVSVDLHDPTHTLTSVVAQSEGTIQEAAVVGKRLLVAYLKDAKSQLLSFDLTGQDQHEIALPGLGTVAGLEGEYGNPETFIGFTNYVTPETIYRLDSHTAQLKPYLIPGSRIDPSRYSVRQVFYPSKDGTSIPMFVISRADRVAIPSSTILYGYGGFNISLTPSYSPGLLAWVEMGGSYAIANLRGGGEYGKAWHDAGRLLNKQNVFDDCAAAAQYLIAQKITSAAQLALRGGSNGGLLVGAVVNQHPELFAAAIPQVGVMDMLRYSEFTAGRYWVDDYGDVHQPEHFKNLLSYSPYHNIRAGVRYPAILVTTADTDDRVVPGHSFKYAARLQATDTGPNPKLIRIETRAGHGSGKPTDKQIEELADIFSFVAKYTGMTISTTP